MIINEAGSNPYMMHVMAVLLTNYHWHLFSVVVVFLWISTVCKFSVAFFLIQCNLKVLFKL